MESLRVPLAAGFLKRIEKELGEEATLSLLWPQVVGSDLGRNTQLKSIRRGTLIVRVPDREFLKSLGSLDALDRMILDAVGRLGTGRKYDAVEFVVAPAMAVTADVAGTNPGPARQAAASQDPGQSFDTTMIGDASSRARFEASAEKYFARQQRRPARSR